MIAFISILIKKLKICVTELGINIVNKTSRVKLGFHITVSGPDSAQTLPLTVAQHHLMVLWKHFLPTFGAVCDSLPAVLEVELNSSSIYSIPDKGNI